MTDQLAQTHATPGGDTGRRASSAHFVRDPTNWRIECLRYAMSAGLAAILCVGLIRAIGTRDDRLEASDAGQAVLVDLPAALASSQPASEAQEGPQQEAMEATPPTPPEEQRQPLTEPKPVAPPQALDPPKEPSRERPMELAQPRLMPPPAEDPTPLDPTVAPPKPADARPQETPPPAPPSPALAEQAPAGSDTPVTGEHPDADEGRTHASPRAITAWQRSLVGRLEAAKRGLVAGSRRTAAGTVQVAFAIDRDGRVVSERVAHSSGSPALDDTALSLVRRAAPFPTPPSGTGDRDLSFIVPIRFKH